jgi:hypothetical protein
MIGFIIVLVIGLVILVKFGRDILLGQKSRSWPKVSGTILQSSLEVHHQTDDDGSTSTTYGVMISYNYSVSGQVYEGNRRTFSDVRTGSRRRTEAILARYPQSVRSTGSLHLCPGNRGGWEHIRPPGLCDCAGPRRTGWCVGYNRVIVAPLISSHKK